MSSPILKSFTFVPQPKPSSDPLIIKRERMIARLEDQKKLLADPNFVRTVKALGAQGRRRESACRKAAPNFQVVAARSERRLRGLKAVTSRLRSRNRVQNDRSSGPIAMGHLVASTSRKLPCRSAVQRLELPG